MKLLSAQNERSKQSRANATIQEEIAKIPPHLYFKLVHPDRQQFTEFNELVSDVSHFLIVSR